MKLFLHFHETDKTYYNLCYSIYDDTVRYTNDISIIYYYDNERIYVGNLILDYKRFIALFIKQLYT